MFDLKREIEAVLEGADGMLITVGKKVLKLEEAPPLIQIRWFKQQVQGMETTNTPAPKKKS
jgi:hypothetical protein